MDHTHPPEPDSWPEGVWLARHYVAAYGLTLPAALDLVYGGPPAGGWVSGPCTDRPGTTGAPGR